MRKGASDRLTRKSSSDSRSSGSFGGCIADTLGVCEYCADVLRLLSDAPPALAATGERSPSSSAEGEAVLGPACQLSRRGILAPGTPAARAPSLDPVLRIAGVADDAVSGESARWLALRRIACRRGSVGFTPNGEDDEVLLASGRCLSRFRSVECGASDASCDWA